MALNRMTLADEDARNTEERPVSRKGVENRLGMDRFVRRREAISHWREPEEKGAKWRTVFFFYDFL